MTTKLDLEKICPELHGHLGNAKGALTHGGEVKILPEVFLTIAACMLELAAENERQRTLIGKIANRISEPARRAREFLMPRMAARTYPPGRKGDAGEQ